MPPIDVKSLVQNIIERITVAADRIEIRLSRAKVAAALQVEGGIDQSHCDPLVLSIGARLRRAGKGKRLIIEDGAEVRANAGLAALIAEAFRIRSQLLSDAAFAIKQGSAARLARTAPVPGLQRPRKLRPTRSTSPNSKTA